MFAYNISEMNQPQYNDAENDQEEFLLKENKDRFTLFPIKNTDIWKAYKKAEASFWTAEEMDLSKDTRDWEALNDNERFFINSCIKGLFVNGSLFSAFFLVIIQYKICFFSREIFIVRKFI